MTLPDYLGRYFDWVANSSGINPPLWVRPSDEELIEHRLTIKQKARFAIWVLGIATAAAFIGILTTESGSLEPFLALALLISFTGLMGAYSVQSSPWLLSSNFWREMYRHEPLQETLGSQLLKAPLAIAGKLALFTIATVFGFMIERDIERILDTAEPNQTLLTNYLLDLTQDLVLYGVAFYLTYSVTVTPFRIHKLYRSDPSFASRHGVSSRSIWLRPVHSYLMFGLVSILLGIALGLASVIFG